MYNLRIYYRQLRKSFQDYIYNLASQYYSYRISTRREPYNFIFILGHMRSGSSLLVHLLNTHPDIIGFGEAGIRYKVEKDFHKLTTKVYTTLNKFKMDHKYSLDKLLHDTKLPNQKLLLNQKLKVIFLIREPRKSISSLLKMKLDWDEKQATEYYTKRLLSLENYAKSINNKESSLFITNNQLLQSTDTVFLTFADFLQISPNFSEQYDILKTTGIRGGTGDSSENIKTGRIIRIPQEQTKEISPILLKKNQQAFDKCNATLSQYCQII